jgi:hypothetical protein
MTTYQPRDTSNVSAPDPSFPPAGDDRGSQGQPGGSAPERPAAEVILPPEPGPVRAKLP